MWDESLRNILHNTIRNGLPGYLLGSSLSDAISTGEDQKKITHKTLEIHD